MGLRFRALDHDHQVVGVADEPVGRVAPGARVSASAGVAAHPLPVRQVGAVERGERDVGQTSKAPEEEEFHQSIVSIIVNRSTDAPHAAWQLRGSPMAPVAGQLALAVVEPKRISWR
jgi:hypothetical protein